MCRAFLRTLSILSWGCSRTREGSGSSSTKWRRDSTSLFVKVRTGFRSSTTRSDRRRKKTFCMASMESKKKPNSKDRFLQLPVASAASSVSVYVSVHSTHLRQFTLVDKSLLVKEPLSLLRAKYLDLRQFIFLVSSVVKLSAGQSEIYM